MGADPVPALRTLGVVPVIVLDDAARAGAVARALADGGLPCVEIAFRTPAAVEAVRRIAAEHPDILVGAGTVLLPEQAAAAREAGARFVVSPGFTPRVVEYCREHALPVFPGVCTPTEINAALAEQLDVLKFFPAEAMGGAAFLRAVAAPYQSVSFIPTGGITVEHLPTYLRIPQVLACGGSWMAPRAWITAGAYDRIRDAARAAVQAVAAARGGH